MTTHQARPRLANLIIAGVNKAGTTSLFSYLAAHPEICGSKDKETCYFLPSLYNEPLSPLHEYQEQFEHCSNSKYYLEATPGYLTGGKKMAETIDGTLGKDVKIIVILKDPVQRFISFYRRKKATLQLPSDITFSEYVNKCLTMPEEHIKERSAHLYSIAATGRYARYLEPWIELFGDRIKVLFSDDLGSDPHSAITSLCNWLKVDGAFYGNFSFDEKNRSMNYRNKPLQKIAVSVNNAGKRIWRNHPNLKKKLLGMYYKWNGTKYTGDELDPSSLQALKNYYKNEIQDLAILLQSHGLKRFPAWIEKAAQPA